MTVAEVQETLSKLDPTLETSVGHVGLSQIGNSYRVVVLLPINKREAEIANSKISSYAPYCAILESEHNMLLDAEKSLERLIREQQE
jgi:hypothetical protein